jgi:hypothetical protein
MEFKISDVQWTMIGHKPLDGSANEAKGDIFAATFTCTCGAVWRATVAPGMQMSPGRFVRTSSSITVDCPECDLRWKSSRAEYEHL